MITEPGKYSLPGAVYHADPAKSSSQLVEACRSLAHYRENSPENPEYQPKEPTEAMKTGSAVHSFLLEPEVFEKEYLISPDRCAYDMVLETVDDLKNYLSHRGVDFKKSAKKSELLEVVRPLLLDGTVTWPDIDPNKIALWPDIMADFSIRAAGRQIVTPEAKRQYQRMGARLGEEDLELAGAKVKMKTLFTVGEAEQSFFWQDKDTGMMCRVRPDWLVMTPNFNLIIDYKTTRDARRGLFRGQAENLYYWMRGAMYVDGVQAVTGVKCDYVLLAQEKESPYLAGCFHYPAQYIEAGQVLYKQKLKEIKAANVAGKWPGYTNQLQSLDLSQYIIDRHDVVKELLYGGQ